MAKSSRTPDITFPIYCIHNGLQIVALVLSILVLSFQYIYLFHCVKSTFQMNMLPFPACSSASRERR